MKCAPFDYVRAHNLNHVLGLLSEWGSRARILAGGQSLLPALALRFDRPELLIDIQDIAELRPAPYQTRSYWRLGAMTRHVELETSPWANEHLPLLAAAAPYIAHRAIRHRGTLGGSLVMAHPAAEWPACLLALGGQVVLQSAGRGERRIAIDDFFTGPFQTQRQEDELLVAVELPCQIPRHHAFREVALRKGDYAAVGLAAASLPGQHGELNSRWVFFGVDDQPYRCISLENALRSCADLDQALNRARVALNNSLKTKADPSYSAEAKKTVALHMVEEVLHEWYA